MEMREQSVFLAEGRLYRGSEVQTVRRGSTGQLREIRAMQDFGLHSKWVFRVLKPLLLDNFTLRDLSKRNEHMSPKDLT